MKKLLSVVAQTILFLIVDVVGGIFYHPFHVRTRLSGSPSEPRIYVWDGVMMMLAVYVVLIAIAALRKRLVVWAPWTTLSLLLAAAAGYGLKLGFITQNW